MAKLLLILAAVCLLSPAIAARNLAAAPKTRFTVEGRVFCDTCLLGYETSASTYLAGVKVRVECRSRETGAEICKFDGETDETGSYQIPVADEHEHETCEVVALSSPHAGCATAVQGRDRAPVFLTTNNGIASSKRFANAVGFQGTGKLAVCDQIVKNYHLYDDEN